LVGSYGRIKRKMTIGKNIEDRKVGNNIKELQRETIKNLYLGGGSYFRQYLLRWHQSKKNGQTKKQLSLYQI
jgi:hypothetical protein